MGQKNSKLSPQELSSLLKTTKFNQKQLLQWHRGFVRDAPEGLTLVQFTQIYTSYFPFGQPQKYASLVFKHLTQELTLDFRAFIKALDISINGTLDAKLAWSFALFDLDEDGFISRAEMLAVVDSIYRMTGRDDGLRRVDDVFGQMDLDGDGLLSRKEFVDGAKGDNQIMASLNLYSALIV